MIKELFKKIKSDKFIQNRTKLRDGEKTKLYIKIYELVEVKKRLKDTRNPIKGYLVPLIIYQYTFHSPMITRSNALI